MTKVYELNKLLSELEIQGGYFIDFISRKGIQAGIIRLHAGENDTQGSCFEIFPHIVPTATIDSYYYNFVRIRGVEPNGHQYQRLCKHSRV